MAKTFTAASIMLLEERELVHQPLGIFSTPARTIFDGLPVFSPLFAPAERPGTGDAHLGWQMLFMHVSDTLDLVAQAFSAP